jgi:hypothetical protein
MAHCDPAEPLPWRREPIYSPLKYEAQVRWHMGVKIIAKAGSQYWLLTPSEDLSMGRIDADAPYRIEHDPDGTIRLSIISPSRTSEMGALAPETRMLKKGRGTRVPS